MFVKKNNLIYFATLILTLLYILSFCKSCSSKDKRQLLKTALVNPKNENLIESFELSDSQNTIMLMQERGNWLVKNSNSELIYPADSKKIQNFIKDLTIIRNMYKISDKNNKNNSFGLSETTAFSVKYYLSSGVYHLYFGNQDFSLSSRFIMTDKSTAIYEIDDSLDKYLITTTQNWAEPYIISQEILGKIKESDIQKAQLITGNKILQISDYSKLLELRHGNLPNYLPEKKSQEAQLLIELGNKSSIQLNIFATEKENEYLIESSYNSNSESTQFFYSIISGWTYNKIKEITL